MAVFHSEKEMTVFSVSSSNFKRNCFTGLRFADHFKSTMCFYLGTIVSFVVVELRVLDLPPTKNRKFINSTCKAL